MPPNTAPLFLPVEAATVSKGKHRRRPTTGAAKAYRDSWGKQWGDFMSKASETLKDENRGEQ